MIISVETWALKISGCIHWGECLMMTVADLHIIDSLELPRLKDEIDLDTDLI